MAENNILQTFGDASRKEDVVLNMVELLTAEENQLLNMLGKTTAIDDIHIYLTDTLETAASNAVAQSDDYTYKSRTTPSRVVNFVQEIAIPFKVSRKQQAVEHYHGQNELDRQLSKALKEWGNSAEFDILRSTLVSGSSGTATKMSGILEGISKSTNYSAQTSGTVFSATILDGIMAANWENSNGDVSTDLFVGGVLRRYIDGFVQKTNVVVGGPGISSIVRTVSTYETAFGTLSIRKHRYIQQSADTTARVLGINREKLKLAYLDKPFIQSDLAKDGPYDARAVYGSLTVEVKNKDSNWFQTGFLKS